MKIVGYAYQADVKCPNCTRVDWLEGRLVEKSHTVLPYETLDNIPDGVDENNIPYDLIDIEGNIISAVFTTSEFDFYLFCANCDNDIDVQIVCYCDDESIECAHEKQDLGVF